MNSRAAAFLWESMFVGLKTRAVFGGCLLLFPLILMGLLTPIVDRDDPAMINIYRIMIGVNSVCIAMFAVDEQNRLGHHYGLPIKTATIVNVRMLCTALRACFDTIIYIVALNLLFKLNLPIYSPVLFSVTIACVVLATHWACEKSVWQPLMLFAPLVPLFLWYLPLSYWFLTRFEATVAMRPERQWLDLLLSIALIAASYVVARIFVARNRQGDYFEWQFKIPVTIASTGFATAPTRPFRSPQEAMRWYHWRLIGWAPIVVAIAVEIIIGVCLLFAEDRKNRWEILLASGFVLPALGLVPAVAAGIVNAKTKSTELPQFLATRPSTNWSLTSPILEVLLKSILIAWGIWLVPIPIFSALVPLQDLEFRSPELQWGAFYYLSILLGYWTVAALYFSLLATGRPWLAVVAFCGPLAFAITVDNLTAGELQKEIWGIIHSLLGLGLVAGSYHAFRTAQRSGQIDSRVTLICIAIWVVLACAATSGIAFHKVHEIRAYLMACGLTALVVLPFATLPLAVAWNRAR